MKRSLLLSTLVLSAAFSIAQSLHVQPKTISAGYTIKFTFSSGNGLEFTEDAPTTNRLRTNVLLCYTNTSGSSTHGTNTQGTFTYDWWGQYMRQQHYQGTQTQGTWTPGTNTQGTYTQGTDTQGTWTQGTYTQGTDLYYYDNATPTSLKSDCAQVKSYDDVIMPEVIKLVNSTTLTASFDVPSYLPDGAIDFIFETEEYCPYVLANNVVVLESVPVPEVDETVAVNVTIYPNPFAAELHFDFDQEIETIRYDIISVNGLIVQSGRFVSMEETVDLSGLTNGIFVVNIYNDNTLVQSNRIMKK